MFLFLDVQLSVSQFPEIFLRQYQLQLLSTGVVFESELVKE